MSRRKCEPDCTCGRHTSRLNPNNKINTPEYRAARAAQARGQWSEDGSLRNPEVQAKMAESAVRAWDNEERRAELREMVEERFRSPAVLAARSEERRGIHPVTGEPAAGVCEDGGYIALTMQYDHPLTVRGKLLEHRKVLYDKIGPGPHPCHWCGVMLEWGGRDGIIADHLDNDTQNNDPANLVPSCNHCNLTRGR